MADLDLYYHRKRSTGLAFGSIHSSCSVVTSFRPLDGRRLRPFRSLGRRQDGFDKAKVFGESGLYLTLPTV